MTIRAKIHCFPEGEQGWVQVDPIDYSYNGPDEDGEVEAYLSGIKSGDIKFLQAMEDDVNTGEVVPDLKIMSIKSRMGGFDPIWFIELPDDYECSISYG